jgi:hypothetical protein
VKPISTDLAKRVDGVPFIPGLFNCPNVDDQIGEDNTDNDLYSDCEFILSKDNIVLNVSLSSSFLVSILFLTLSSLTKIFNRTDDGKLLFLAGSLTLTYSRRDIPSGTCGRI